MKNQSDDSSKIPMPAEPKARELLMEISAHEHAALTLGTSPKYSRKDYRAMVNYSLAATEDFLQETSKDPYYGRSSNVAHYKSGGWL